MINLLTIIFISIGLLFFVGGILGLLRFPDIYTRLHALTKADNVGLGFIIIGLLLQTNDINLILKMIFIWMLIILSSATICYLIARSARSMDIEPWRDS